MKNLPLKYRLNVIGGSLIIFIAIRTYLPQLAKAAGLGANFDVWIVACMVVRILSCILPIAFIEKMCDFHPMLFKKEKPHLAHSTIIMENMMVFIGLAVINGLVLSLLSKVGVNFPAQELEPINSWLTFVLYFVFSTIVPAVSEELYLRGIVLNVLLPNGRRFAVLASAIIFTIMHTQVQSFIPVFGAGVILGCIYLYTDNIYVSMGLHFVNNTYSFMMMYMQQRVNNISSMGFAVFVIAAILVVGISSKLYNTKNKIEIMSVIYDTGKNSSLKKLLSSPVMVLGLICCLVAVFSQLYADLTMI